MSKPAAITELCIPPPLPRPPPPRSCTQFLSNIACISLLIFALLGGHALVHVLSFRFLRIKLSIDLYVERSTANLQQALARLPKSLANRGHFDVAPRNGDAGTIPVSAVAGRYRLFAASNNIN